MNQSKSPYAKKRNNKQQLKKKPENTENQYSPAFTKCLATGKVTALLYFSAENKINYFFNAFYRHKRYSVLYVFRNIRQITFVRIRN